MVTMRLHPTLVTIFALVSCAAPSSAPSSVDAAIPGIVRNAPAGVANSVPALSSESLKRALGGSFTASYLGEYTYHNYVDFSVFSLHGGGRGTFIGSSSLKGGFECGRYFYGGRFTFRSTKHPVDSFRARLKPGGTYCPGGSYTVTGGKGKFANASGGGTVSFFFDYLNHTFTSSWTGTLNF